MVPEASLDVSRRQFLAVAGLTVAAACLPRYLVAQAGGLVQGAFKEAAKAKVTVQTLRRNVSVLLGAGGNIAVLVGPDGKLLVDAEIITARPHVSEALASINGDPVQQLINTHWHFDHTGGNEWIHEAGASILAHENTRKHLIQATHVGGNWQYTFPAAPAGAIPSIVFGDNHALHVNNTTLMLKHYPPAHTDSDISVHFAEADSSHRRHLLEPRLSFYRLRNRGKHRRPNTSGRGEYRVSDRQDDRHSRTRSCGRQGRPDSIPRRVGRDPRSGCGSQKAG
jgi:hypothetical protein